MRDRTQNEGPADDEVCSPLQAPSAGNSRTLARTGGVGETPKQRVARRLRKITEVGSGSVCERDWRLDFQRFDEFHLSAVASLSAPDTIAIHSVVIFGLDKLDPASPARKALEVSGPDNAVQHALGVRLGFDPEKDGHFLNRWAETIAFHMGADEAEKFFLAAAQRLHGRTE